jgi:tRNA/rRNA methyltransferase
MALITNDLIQFVVVDIIFILSNPAREENVGAAARAIKTMGISELRLVNPICDHLGERARATAHGSTDVLENAQVFKNLPDAATDLSLLIGTAAKKRNIREDRHPVEELPALLQAKGNTISRTGVAFGGEESGLSNRELDHCHLLTTIPMAARYPSLNLGQAVMVYASILSKLTLQLSPKKQNKPTDDELNIVREKALQVLSDVEIPGEHIIHRRIMERLMLLKEDDMHLFHSFCKFYLKKYHGRVK